MKRYLFIFLFSLIFFSCSDSKTVLLWSDRREMADIVELYNRSGSEQRIMFHYKEDLVSSFVDADEKPDIIIGGDLANKLIKEELSTLTPDVVETIIPSLKGGTDLDSAIKLIPLSYSPQTILFRKESKRIGGNNSSISLEEIRDLSLSYNEEKKRGYSPFWDRDFLLTSLDLYGSDFRSSTEHILQWNENKVNSALRFLLDWHQVNMESGDMDLFDEKYLYENRLKILKEERILFSSMSLGDFMSLSDAMTRDLDFLYISHINTINTGEVIYGGIFRKTNNKERATDFFNWLLEEDNQETIISSALSNKTGTFGFLGGLSAVNEVNTTIIPQYYPLLQGKIPEIAYLQRLSEKPEGYNTVKYDLLAPWLEKRKNDEEISLELAMERWEKLRIPY